MVHGEWLRHGMVHLSITVSHFISTMHTPLNETAGLEIFSAEKTGLALV